MAGSFKKACVLLWLTSLPSAVQAFGTEMAKFKANTFRPELLLLLVLLVFLSLRVETRVGERYKGYEENTNK